MANEPEKAPEMLRRWSRAPVLAEDMHHDPDRRDRVIATVAATIAAAHGSRRRRSMQRWASGLAAAALIALGWGLTVRGGAGAHASLSAVLGGVHLVHAGRDGAVSGSAAVVERDEVTTDEQSSVDLTLASGARVAIESGSRVQLERAIATHSVADEQVLLQTGLVQVRVPKLGEGGAMRVRTPDALITVHGTAFSVEVSGSGDHPRTEVHVSEGVVSVDHLAGHTLLTAGMTWSSRPASAAVRGAPLPGPDEDAARAAPSVQPRGAAELRRPAREPRASSAHRELGTLPEQNRAFADAMSARRQGDPKTAVRLLEAFVDRYPDSPLLQSAYVERFRALAYIGDHRGAARAASRYLVDFPQGFARQEATQLERSAPAPN